MKKYKVSFNLISLYLLTLISVLFNNPLRSAPTVLECEGKIPTIPTQLFQGVYLLCHKPPY